MTPQSAIDRLTAEWTELHATGQISQEVLDRELAILNDPNDPLDGGYGMCLPVETTEIEPGVRELSTVWLTRKQLQENSWEWVLADLRKQCEKIVRLTPKRDDYPAQFQRLEQRAEAIWRKLNASSHRG